MAKKLLAALTALFVALSIGNARADYQVKDGAGTTKYFKSSGTGSSGDPYIPEHKATDGGGSLSVDDNGSTLSVDDGGSSITVDNGGTFAVQATQSGTWTSNLAPLTTSIAYQNDTSNTSVTLIAGSVGQTIRLYDLILSVDVADTISVKCATSTKAGFQFSALSGIHLKLFPEVLACGSGEALVITKGTGATNLHATAIYTQG